MTLDSLLRQIDENQVKINNYKPFDFEHLELVKDFYRMENVYSSNTLEGYKYTLSETQLLLEEKLVAEEKPVKDMHAALGLVNAYDYMFTLINSSGISEQDIIFFHKSIGDSLRDESVAGEYRKHDIFISASKYFLPLPEDIASEMALFINFIQTERKDLHPILFAAELHNKFVYMYPFGEGNGRVARLIMNVSLIQKGFLPIVIPPASKTEYIDSLEIAGVDTDPFYKLICQCALEAQKNLMGFLELE